MKVYPAFLVLIFSFLTFNLSAQDLLTKQTPLPCLNKTFSVVLHIVLDSTGMSNVEQEDIDSSFIELNNQFAPICVGFEVCETIEIENWQYNSLNDDKWEEMQVLYHQKNRINIFIVQNIGLPEPECGFAEIEGIGNLDNNGIVIAKGDCLNWQTFTHEMGHYFGLYHTFEADEFGPGLVDDEIDCDTTGDLVCDTAADLSLIHI